MEVTRDFSSYQVFSSRKLINNKSVNLCCTGILDPSSYNNIEHMIYVYVCTSVQNAEVACKWLNIEILTPIFNGSVCVTSKCVRRLTIHHYCCLQCTVMKNECTKSDRREKGDFSPLGDSAVSNLVSFLPEEKKKVKSEETIRDAANFLMKLYDTILPVTHSLDLMTAPVSTKCDHQFCK